MCGIAGVLDPRASTNEADLRRTVEAMADAQRDRGPDGSGSWVDPTSGVALAFRRLAILDLSDLGAQPMASRSGRWVVVFNGEIYNHRALRAQLSGDVSFRGTSDTETLVAAIDRWGPVGAAERCIGMFAFAAWDGRERRLHLVRDRLGEKPLYYGWAGERFVFGSTLDALRTVGGFDRTIDRRALSRYLALTHVPAPMTIHVGARTVPAGHHLVVEPRGGRPGTRPTAQPWWSPDAAIDAAVAAPFRGSIEDASVAVDDLLAEAVAARLLSDVPLGCFLSGGMDSSLVAALAQHATGRAIRTFTVRMPELGLDESADAAAVAAHLGTDHTCVDLAVGDALALVPTLPRVYGEPFGDPSAIPSLLVCGAARRSVTVALGGDGGDELFVGYNRYVLGSRVWERIRRVPGPARRVAGRALGSLRPATVDRLLAGRVPVRNPGDKVRKLAALLAASDRAAYADALVEAWPAGEVVDDGSLPEDRGDAAGGGHDLVEHLVRRDVATTLPDQMLVKLDRASMAVSLEARSPLVDHRLLGLVWSMPLTWHADRTGGKRLLRRALLRRVPAALVDRPKMGFDPPIGSWLRGPLRSWGEDLLDPSTLRAHGLRPDAIQRHWRDHQSGAAQHDYRLWTVLQYLAWAEAA